MTTMKWWLRVVGSFYLLLFVMVALVKAPIREEGPAGVLELAAQGDPLAKFAVDTWITFGLYLGAVGVGLLVTSRVPARARALVGTVASMEVAGIIADIYKIMRGYELRAPVAWMCLHGVIIATGLWALRHASRTVPPVSVPANISL
jgi:hypothetical protein